MSPSPSMLPPIAIARDDLMSLRHDRDALVELRGALAVEASLSMGERLWLTMHRRVVADGGRPSKQIFTNESSWWERLWINPFRK